MRAWLLPAAVAGGLLAGCAHAQERAQDRAQERTGPWIDRGRLAEALAVRYAERPVAAFLAADGTVLELFAAAPGEGWTIAVTLPDGRARIAAAGAAWWPAPAAPPRTIGAGR